ncbi:MAG: pseudouridine synthase [Roseburia sp.]
MRMDKFLCEMNMGTRSQVKGIIKKGRVTVNDTVALRPEQKVDPQKDLICVDGKTISYVEFVYYMLHKPSGCVSAKTDDRYPTVLDFIGEEPRREELFPVGRLDLDTEGLLLLTNDGELSHRLLSPAHHVPKTYYAKINGVVTGQDVDAFARGLDIGEKMLTKPAELTILKAGEISEIQVSITEGKYHQIKRMFACVGKEVVYLKRLSMGSLMLDESLAPGQYRPLTDEEILELRGGKDR